LLVSLLLVVGVSILMSRAHFYWTLVVREVLLVLGPAVLVLLLLRLPWRETLRWRWPSWRVQVASVLIGLGGWLFDMWLGALFGELLGYSLPLPADFYPTTFAQSLILLGLLAIAAPICEEVLFRGLIQRGYEQLGVWPSILCTGLLFMLFHQSLAQGLALIPLAILLSYLAWRTDSLLTAILAHAVNNAPGALLLPLSIVLLDLSATSESAASAELAADWSARLSSVSPAICTLPIALLGLLLMLGGLWGIRRWCPAPPPLRRAPLRPGFGRWLGRTWPLLIILPFILFVMASEVAMGRFPELLSMGRPVQWAVAPWAADLSSGPRTWRYEVRNALGKTVGTIECALEAQPSVYRLACSRQQSAYEADTGHGVYYGSDVDENLAAEWQRSDLRLQSVERQREKGDGGWQSISARTVGTAVDVALRPQEGVPSLLRLPLPEPSTTAGLMSLLPGRSRPPTLIERAEWPWRFSALPFQAVYSAQAVLLDPDPPEGGDPTLSRTTVVVYGADPVSTPAGAFVAWRVEVGPDHVAWYDAEEPHTLVALEDGIEKWVLVSVE